MEIPCSRRLAGRGLVLGAALFAGATACSSSGLVQHTSRTEATQCSSHKVGEERGVIRADIPTVQRRMGGDFVRVLSDSPGRTSEEGRLQTYTVEVYRYNDRQCAGRRT